MDELQNLLDNMNDFLGFISPLGDDMDWDTMVSIQGRFNSFLTAMYTFFSHATFPNLSYTLYDHNFYYLDLSKIVTEPFQGGLFWKSIPNFTTPIVFSNRLALRHRFQALEDVKVNQVQYLISSLKPTSPLFGGINLNQATNGQLFKLPPYLGATRYLFRQFSYYANGRFNNIDIQLLGTLRALGNKVEYKTTSVWQGVTLAQEGQVRAKADDSGLEVYRVGSWQPLFTF